VTVNLVSRIYCECSRICSVYQWNIYETCPWICSGCRYRNLFPHSWFITGFVTRVTWLVLQELLTRSEHLI